VLKDVEVIFSTWGMPCLTAAQLESMPRLRAVFYAAGSVQDFARPLLESGIRIVSAWRENADAVAHFTLAQLILSTKGYFRNLREYTGAAGSFQEAYRGPGIYGETIALLGCGAVGRRVVELLKSCDARVIVFDPFLPAEAGQELGVEIVTLAAAFERGYVVSNHLANKPETTAMIGAALLGRMRTGATFINTGRGRTVVEAELVEVLRRRPDLTALLDVTFPEPTPADTPLRSLSNVHISTHIAGATNNEVHRLADLCIAEFDRYARGDALQHEVTLAALALLA
jgi:phosphoglycerate dehydrogenase-like enzyme